jgi:hypothetical protein
MFSDRDIFVPKIYGYFVPGCFVQVSRGWREAREGELLFNLGTHVSPDLSFCPSCVTKRHALPAPYSCLFKYCSELLNQLAVIEIFPDLLARSSDDAVTQILIK